VSAQDPIVSRSTSGAILVSALLLTLSLAWALYDEAYGQRPWKGMQREFVARYTRYLDSLKTNAKDGEDEIRNSAPFIKLDEAAKDAKARVKPEIDQIDSEVKLVQTKLDAVTEPFQNQRGRLTVISYNIETSTGRAKEKYRKQAEDKRAETVAVDMPNDGGAGTSVVQMNFDKLEQTYNGLREKKAERLGHKAELLKEPSELEKQRDDYLKNHLTILTPSQIEGVKRGLKTFDYSILGHQVSVNDYNIVDRCEVCHLGVRAPLNLTAEDLAPGGPGHKPDDLARAFVSHPNRELLDVHKPDKFGCSSCHWGNGRATTSESKGHGLNKFWLWPMFEKENTEAGCQQCHAKDRVTQGADTLNLGRDLFYQRGCMGCHRYEGFDRESDTLTNTRQTISQFEDQITANEKFRRQDAAAAATASDEDAVKLRAHAESLRVTNSLLAARIDQMNLQSKYLLQDQKKIGPNLKDVRLKLHKEWIPLWLKDPQAFRPGTKMPTFWRFSVDQNGDDEIKAISAYLWQAGFDGRVPDQQRGAATNIAAGKKLFEEKGCLACHSIGEGGSKMGGTFAANLTKVGEKANFEYITRWIHNPRQRWAPFCPKHGRDLTPDDYAKAGKPFIFDTELHSKCPLDGAELQVQNMTVMPNFRLSESEARDIANYLFSLSSPPAANNLAYMDDPALKQQGFQLIKQFGCAGCHEIKGFEFEQRIGKELSVEGATPIERLDFALQTQRAEQGEEPIEALKESGKGKEWYSHKGFFEHKLADPSVYDQGKEKAPQDRLRMPRPFLTDEWRTALTTFLLGSVGTEGANVPRTLFYDPQDQRRQDVQNGWWVIKKYNCMGCHSIQVGQRSVLMDLPLYEAAEKKDFLPPRLSSEGARVDPNWLLRFLEDPSLSGGEAQTPTPSAPATPNAAAGAATPAGNQLPPQPGADRNGVRPYLTVRMPTFNFSPNERQTLVRFFMAVSGQQDPYIKEQLEPLTEQEKVVARQMFTSGIPCLSCHVTGDPAHDDKKIAPNFLLASQRLKPDWTYRWLPMPSAISPGVGMPDELFIKDGDRYVANLPHPPKDVSEYKQDHAMLLVRYMFLMTPDEQRRLLSTPPVTPTAAAAPAAPTPANKTSWYKSRQGAAGKAVAFSRSGARPSAAMAGGR
jgi:cytochrome c2